jgi:predicted alpha/beta-fold hydrolase
MKHGKLNPPFYLRSTIVPDRAGQCQTACIGEKSSGRRLPGRRILTTTDGVRLLGYMSRQPMLHNNGLVILLHGWEGSSESTYIRTTGRFLYQPRF